MPSLGGIAGAVAGSARVEILPDFSRFLNRLNQGVDQAVRRATGKVTVGMTADGSGLGREVAQEAKKAEIGKEINLPVKIDSAAFQRALGGLNNTAGGALQNTSMFASTLGAIRFPALVTGAQLGAQAISALGAAALAVAGQLAQLSGVAAAFPNFLAAGTQAAGTAGLAFFGVGDALKAMQTAQEQAVTTGTGAGRSLVAAARAQEAAIERVGDAQRALTRAARSAADAFEAAQERMRNAVLALQRAEQNAARAIVAANRRIQDAKRALAGAQMAVTRSQERLTQARMDAARRIRELRGEVEDLALAERRAQLELDKARERMQAMEGDETFSETERREAQLYYDEQAAALEDIKRRRREANAELMEANRQGVEGSREVRDALYELAEAIQREIDSRQGLADAEAELQQARIDGEQAVADARRDVAMAERDLNRTRQDGIDQVLDAQRELERAIRDAGRAVEDTAGSGGAAVDTLAQKMAQLPPAAQRFAEFLYGLKPQLDILRNTAAEGFLPGLQEGMQSALGLFPLVNQAIGDTASVMGDLAREFGAMIASGPWRADLGAILQNNVGLDRTFGDVGMNLANALRHIMVAALPLTNNLANLALKWSENASRSAEAGRETGRLQAFFERTWQTVETFTSILGNLGRTFINIGSAGRDLGQGLLEGLDRVTERWANWTGSIEGQNKLKDWFDSAKAPLQELGGLIKDVAGIFGGMTNVGGLTETIRAIRDEFIPVLERIATSGDKAFGPRLVSLVTKFISIFDRLSGHSGHLIGFIDVLDAFLGVVDKLIANVPGAHSFVLTMGSLGLAFKAFNIGPIIQGIAHLPGAIETASGAFRGLSTGFKAMTTFFQANPFVLLIAAVAALAFIIIQNWDAIWAKTQEIWSAVWGFIGPIWDSIVSAVDTAGTRVREFVGKAWDWIQDRTSAIWNGITGFLGGIWNRISNMASGAWNWVTDTIGRAVDRVRDWVTNIWNGITGFLTGAWDRIRFYAGGAWDALTDMIGRAIDRARDWVTRVADNIRDRVVGAFDWVRDRVADAWNWVERNIVDPIQRAWDFVGRAVDGIVRWFNNLLADARRIASQIGQAIEDAFWRMMPGSPIPLVFFAEKTAKGVRDAFGGLSRDIAGIGRQMDFEPLSIGAERAMAATAAAAAPAMPQQVQAMPAFQPTIVTQNGPSAAELVGEIGWLYTGVRRGRR